MLELNKYSHIMWDFNGTLINDVAMCVDVLNMILVKYNVPTTSVEQYIEDFAHPVRDYYEGLGIDFSTCDFDEIAIMFNSEYDQRRSQCHLQPYAVDALKYFKKAGLGQSVLSAYQQHRLIKALDAFQLSGYFTEVAGLDDHYAHSKVERGQKLLDILNSDPSEILLIGDTEHDHEVAKELRIDCVLIARGHNHRSKLMDCDVPVYVSLEELIVSE